MRLTKLIVFLEIFALLADPGWAAISSSIPHRTASIPSAAFASEAFAAAIVHFPIFPGNKKPRIETFRQEGHTAGKTFRLRDGRLIGYEDSGSGIPVIYFPGWPESRIGHTPAAGFLKDLGIRFIAIDPPGSGLSSPKNETQVAEVAADIAALLDHLQINHVILLGHSLGGVMAQAVAAQLGDRVITLGLVSSAPPTTRSKERRAFNPFYRVLVNLLLHHPWISDSILAPLLQRAILFHGPSVQRFFRSWMAPDDARLLLDPEISARMQNSLVEAQRQGGSHALHRLRTGFQPWGFSPEQIRAVTYLWHGIEDRNVPIALGKKLAQMIPDSIPDFIPGRGHLFIREAMGSILKRLTAPQVVVMNRSLEVQGPRVFSVQPGQTVLQAIEPLLKQNPAHFKVELVSAFEDPRELDPEEWGDIQLGRGDRINILTSLPITLVPKVRDDRTDTYQVVRADTVHRTSEIEKIRKTIDVWQSHAIGTSTTYVSRGHALADTLKKARNLRTLKVSLPEIDRMTPLLQHVWLVLQEDNVLGYFHVSDLSANTIEIIVAVHPDYAGLDVAAGFLPAVLEKVMPSKPLTLVPRGQPERYIISGSLPELLPLWKDLGHSENGHVLMSRLEALKLIQIWHERGLPMTSNSLQRPARQTVPRSRPPVNREPSEELRIHLDEALPTQPKMFDFTIDLTSEWWGRPLPMLVLPPFAQPAREMIWSFSWLWQWLYALPLLDLLADAGNGWYNRKMQKEGDRGYSYLFPIVSVVGLLVLMGLTHEGVISHPWTAWALTALWAGYTGIKFSALHPQPLKNVHPYWAVVRQAGLTFLTFVPFLLMPTGWAELLPESGQAFLQGTFMHFYPHALLPGIGLHMVFQFILDHTIDKSTRPAIEAPLSRSA